MKKRGFTLVELMIVIVIIGILAAVAIPKFADMVDKSKEGATKGQLTALRGALQVYYGDNEGKYLIASDVTQTDTPNPTNVLRDYLIPKYISQIGEAKVPKTNCTDNSNAVYAVNIPTAHASNQGGWAYDGNNTNNTWGDIRVNCNQNDLKGNPWTSY